MGVIDRDVARTEHRANTPTVQVGRCWRDAGIGICRVTIGASSWSGAAGVDNPVHTGRLLPYLRSEDRASRPEHGDDHQADEPGATVPRRFGWPRGLVW
jgi:hypothetical protein